MEGVTFQQPSYGKVCALDRTVTADGNICVLGAGRRKATVPPDIRRYCRLVKTNENQKQFPKHFHFISILIFCIPVVLFSLPQKAGAVVFCINAAGNGRFHDNPPRRTARGQ